METQEGNDGLAGFLHALRVLGLSHLWKLRQAQRLGTPIERGFFATRVIQCLFNVGFFDELATKGAVDLSAYAQRNHLDAGILQILCDYLYALRFLSKDEGRYGLDQKGENLIETLRGTFDIIYAYEDLVHNLESLLRTEKAYGQDVKRREEFVGKGSGQSAKLLPFPMTIDLIERNGFSTILDLGCGDGEFLISLCKKDVRFRGYGIDISQEVVSLAKLNVSKARLDGQVQLMVGDIFDLKALRGRIKAPDAATCFYVLHEFPRYGRHSVIDFLRQFHDAFPGTPLITCEITRLQPNEFRRKPTIILEHHLFHDLSKQSSIPREEWGRIFTEADFRLIEEVRLDFAEMSIFHLA